MSASLPALAVGQTAPAAPSNTTEEGEVKLEKFVVTGSYIPATETAINAGVSPVVQIDRKVIDQSGFTNTADLLQKITISNGNAVPISNNATGFTPGATSVSLRALGPEATLVLINGRRVAPYPVGTGGTTAFVDLNSIPLSAVESIEILKDGASALYGADAVAGVVNIKMRRGFDGTEAFVSYGNTTKADSSEVTASLITGASTDRANIVAGLNYYKKNAIANRDRDYSAVPPFLSSNSSPLNLELSRNAVLAAGVPASSIPAGLSFFGQSGATSGNNGAVPAANYVYSAGRSSTFNFNEFSMSYPSSKRLGAFAFGERKIFGTDNIKAYIDLSYQNVKTENQLAPSATGNFNTSGQVQLIIPARTATPILTYNLGGVQTTVAAGAAVPAGATPGPGTKFVNGMAQRLAPEGAFNPFNPFNQDISGGSRARFAEFGNRIFRNQTDAFMFATGIKGESIMDKWNADLNFSYSSIRDTSRNTLNSSSSFNRILNANDSFFQSGSGDFAGTTTPYNPFGYYRNPIASNALVTDLVKFDVKDVNESTLGQVQFVAATGDLFALPAGGVGFAVGGDFRHEQLDQFPDPLGRTGDLIGSSPNAITRAQRKIGGIFVEGRIPVLENLEVSLAARHEKFFTSDRDATVPKIGVRWMPIPNELTVRASYSEGFREPSLYELYSSPVAALTPITDPRNGAFESEQPITLAGNRRLEAEETEYINVGVVWSPEAPSLKGLTLGVDLWRIERQGTVDADPQDTVDRILGTAPGGALPGESVLLTPSGLIDVVNSVFFNVGQTKAEGVDLSASYTWSTDTLGRFEATTYWTFLNKFERASVAGAPLVDLVGTDVTGIGEDGYLEWKGRVNLEWTYRGFVVFISGLYNDGFEDFDLNGDPFQVDDRFLVDAQVSYNFRDTMGEWLADTKLTIGARNVFDRDPPQSFGFGGNSTGYPSFLYSSEGQFVYAALSRKF
ncbi:MAG TPA: TonB-dependent receptor [Opitutaceae bacterium]|nr:TonB-dependent receptor [Opitutaceae bacterium]